MYLSVQKLMSYHYNQLSARPEGDDGASYSMESYESNLPLSPNRGRRVQEKPLPTPVQSTKPVQTAPRPRGWVVLATGFGILFVVALPVIGLLTILAVNKPYFADGYVFSLASLGPTLVIAHACSTVVTATVPIVMGLVAYRFAALWLASSRTESANRPTVYQCANQYPITLTNH